MRPMPRLAAVAGLALAATALAGCGADEPVDLPDADTYARALFDETNAVRAKNDLEPLMWDDCLAAEATERADAVKDDEKLTHATLTAQCTDGELAGENLIRMDVQPDEAVDAWMNSPSHAANILTPGYHYLGVGCVPAAQALACSWVAEGDPGAGSAIS
ncbi:CAP domain-containing protein [Demequina sp. NBRC 110055]|uniref:CAP domain-containing protein n=1 Tax=Demequina sp. NBRC 110055 TaxID=1570344 RepID=UPI0009FF50F7|nr:CAP domain-containing protein [Demequina sp. NBRC 110055]